MKQRTFQSLSGAVYCYDNARMESFFATLKKELICRIPAYRMLMDQVKNLIFCYVFVYFNRLRMYTTSHGGLLGIGLVCFTTKK